MKTFSRIGLSFGCKLLSIALYSLMGILSAPHGAHLRTVVDVFPVTLLFAFPVWLLSLPLVVALRDAERWRGWVILITGVSLGPAFLLIWSLAAQSSGGRLTWEREGFFLISALMVSFLTTLFYVLTLKFTHRRFMASGQ